MENRRTDNALRNLTWGMLNKIIGLLLPFISRTVMIYSMGFQYEGLGSLFSAILGVLSFAELGVGSAIVYSMYKPIAYKDDEKVCQLLGLYKKIYRIIGIVILFIGICIIPFLDKLISGEIPADVNVRTLFAVYLFNNVIGYFLGAYRSSIFLASQRVDIQTKISLFVSVALHSTQILLLLFTHSYLAYAVVIPIMTILNNLIITYFSKLLYPQYFPKEGLPKTEIYSIGKKILGMLFQKIGGIVLSSADTIVISSFLGLTVLGIYNGYYYIITAIVGFLNIIQTALIPSIGNSVAKEGVLKNYQDFCRFQFIYNWILSWCSACLVCLYQPFMSIWQGRDNILPFYMVVLFAVYFFTYHMGDFVYIYKESLGLWWEAKFIPLISSIINLSLNIFLVKSIGLPGILISTIASIVLINVPFGGGVLFKNYFHDKKKFKIYLMNLLKGFIIAAGTCSITYLICNGLATSNSWLELFKNAIICIVVPNLILFVVYSNTREFKESAILLRGILSRIIK